MKGQEENVFFKDAVANMLRTLQNEGLMTQIAVLNYIGLKILNILFDLLSIIFAVIHILRKVSHIDILKTTFAPELFPKGSPPNGICNINRI